MKQIKNALGSIISGTLIAILCIVAIAFINAFAITPEGTLSTGANIAILVLAIAGPLLDWVLHFVGLMKLKHTKEIHFKIGGFFKTFSLLWAIVLFILSLIPATKNYPVVLDQLSYLWAFITFFEMILGCISVDKQTKASPSLSRLNLICVLIAIAIAVTFIIVTAVGKSLPEVATKVLSIIFAVITSIESVLYFLMLVFTRCGIKE